MKMVSNTFRGGHSILREEEKISGTPRAQRFRIGKFVMECMGKVDWSFDYITFSLVVEEADFTKPKRRERRW